MCPFGVAEKVYVCGRHRNGGGAFDDCCWMAPLSIPGLGLDGVP